jgi:hypothetical protein
MATMGAAKATWTDDAHPARSGEPEVRNADKPAKCICECCADTRLASGKRR